MEKNRDELRVGIALLVALAALVGGILWAKGFSLKVRQYDITVVFDDVQGLENGSKVLASGVEKGRVHKIYLKDGRVYLRASIEKDVKLYSDYRIIVDSPTILAGKIISIYPGQKLPYANADSVLIGSPTVGMAQAVEIFKDISIDLKTTINNLNTLMIHMNEIVGDSTNQANIAGTLAHSADVAKFSADWLHDNRESLTKTLDQIEVTFTKAQDVLATTQTQLSTSLVGFDTTLVQINEVSVSLRKVLDAMNDDHSTAGKLLHDDELYVRLNKVLAELDALSTDVRTHGLKMRHSLKIF